MEFFYLRRYISKNIKVKDLQLAITLPNRTKIGNIVDKFNETITMNYGKVHELTFSIPLKFSYFHQYKENPLLELLKPWYLIKAEFYGMTEWFVITKKTKTLNVDSSAYTFECQSLPYLQNTK